MQGVIGAIPLGGFGGAGAPQGVDPLPTWLRAAASQKSFFKSAEKWTADS